MAVIGEIIPQEFACARCECIASRIRMLDRVVNGLFDDALRPVGLTAGQMNILHMTSQMGVARAAEMCRTLHIDTSTISRNVERMRRRGLIEVVDGGDARSRPFRVTEAGSRILEYADPAWQAAQIRAQAMLGEEGLRLLDVVSQRIGAPLCAEDGMQAAFGPVANSTE